MENIIYDNASWDEKRQGVIKRDVVKFNARTKDIMFALDYETVTMLSAIEHNLLDISDKHLKFALRYVEMCNEDNICKENGKKTLGPLEAKFFFNMNLYDLHWVLRDDIEKECAETLLSCIQEDYLAETRKRDKIAAQINQETNIGLCTRFGKFELAKQELDRYCDIKEVKLEKDIIYDFYGFYFMLLDYFIHKDMEKKEQIHEIFLHFFHEHEKGNRTLWYKQGAFYGIYNIYYIYYKHFLGLPEEELTAYNVLRSAENGICFWKK